LYNKKGGESYAAGEDVVSFGWSRVWRSVYYGIYDEGEEVAKSMKGNNWISGKFKTAAATKKKSVI
jgi:endonuclease YncB( thermonuclease family)